MFNQRQKVPTPSQELRQPTISTPTYYDNDYRQTLNASPNERILTSLGAKDFHNKIPTPERVTSLSYNNRDYVQTNSFPTSDFIPESHNDEVRTNRRCAEHVRSIYDNVDYDGLTEKETKNEAKTSYTALHTTQQLVLTSNDNSLPQRTPSSLGKNNHGSNSLEKPHVINNVNDIALSNEKVENKLEDSTTTNVKNFIKKLNNQDTPTINIETIYDIKDDQSYRTNSENVSFKTDKNLAENRTTNDSRTTPTANTAQVRSSTARQSITEDLIQKFNNNTSLDAPRKPDQLNTLQRLSKEGKVSIRCAKCKFHIVQKSNEYCQQCLSQYLDTLKKKVSPSQSQQQPQDAPTLAVTSLPVVDNSHTLEKVKKHVIKKLKCAQCGWKQVDAEGRVCDDCTSEYL